MVVRIVAVVGIAVESVGKGVDDLVVVVVVVVGAVRGMVKSPLVVDVDTEIGS